MKMDKRIGIFFAGVLVTVVVGFLWCNFSNNNRQVQRGDSESAIAVDRVNKAIDLVSLVGREEAFEVLDSGFAVHGDWYVFIYNKATGLQAVNPWGEIPGDIRDWKDLDGKPTGIEIYNASTEGEFIEYSFTAPVSGKDVKRYKRSFIKLSDGYIYGAGYYQERNGGIHESYDLDGDGINDCELDGSCDHTIDYTKERTTRGIHESYDLDGDGINDCELDGSCDHTIDYTKERTTNGLDY